MGINDEFEKLRYAADLLRSGTASEKDAAMDHVEYILRTSTSASLRFEADRIKNAERRRQLGKL